MAKKISDEVIKLSIVIDGNPAQAELLKLETSTRKLTKVQAELRKEKSELVKQGLKESERYKEVNKLMKENTATINANKNKMAELQKEIGLTGLTMTQLTQKAHILKMALKGSIPNGEAYNRYKNELAAVSARMDELNGKAKQTGSFLGSFADNFNRFAALGAAVIGVLAGVVVSIQKVLDWNAKLADAQSNVQKTTGMTKDEVDDLTKSFGILQTRTSRIELLGIAEVGGRLGIAKNEIKDFVKVMDKASVALGDSFEGGPEVVADKLGKIKGLYKELKDTGVELAFNAVGSAINDLGASGTATEQNLAAFATRVGSLPDALKPSIAQALGLGAAFEESGLNAELAGNNYGKVISIASRDFPKFAKVMGVSADKVKDLLNTNPTEFFLQFSNSLKGLDATELSSILDYLKLNDNEVKMVLGAASQNVQLFRDKMELANKSINEGTSLTAEFDLKNNNLAATLEKLQKKIVGAFSSETIVNWLANAVDWFAKLVNATGSADSSFQKWRNTIIFAAKAIAIITAALLTNVAWQKLVVLWTNRNTAGNLLYTLGVKARALAEGTGMVATQLYAIATALLTGNIKKAWMELRILAAVMKTTPWGLILSLLAAVGAAYLVFSKETEKAITRQQFLNSVLREAEGIVEKETATLKTLVAVAQDETASKEARLAAIKKINEISPEYLGNLTLENIKTLQGKDILDKYIKSLERKAELEVLTARQSALIQKRQELKNKSLEEEIEWYDKLWAVGIGKSQEEISKDLLLTAIEKRKKALKELQVELDLTNEEMKKYLIDNPDLINQIDSNIANPKASLPGDAVKAKKEKKYDDSYLRDEEKLSDELLKIRKKSEEDKIATMKDGFEREMAQEEINHKYKILELKNQMASERELQKIDTEIVSAKKAGDNPKIKALESIKKMMLEKNSEINKQIEYEDTLHYWRVGTILEKADHERINKSEENYKREKTKRLTEFNNQLAQVKNLEQAKAILKETLSVQELSKIKTLESAKKALQEEFDKQEVLREKEHLEKLLKEMQGMITSVQISGIELNLLTPEQRDKIQKQIEEVKLLISQLSAAKKGGAEDEFVKNDLGLGGDVDILGFSSSQWDMLFENLEHGKVGVQEISMAVNSLKNLWGSYNEILTQNENNQLKKFEQSSNAKKRKLKQQLDDGYISQNLYNKKVDDIDKSVELKKAEIEYKQAKRKKAMSIADTIINTSVAIMQAYSQLGPIGGSIAAALIGTLGALQINAIRKEPLPSKTPGYEDGLYPEYLNVEREQDGKKFRPKYAGRLKSGLVTQNSLMVAEGNKPEMIIDNKAWQKMDPKVQEALINDLKGIKGFENGYYRDGILYSGGSSPQPEPEPTNSNDEMLKIMMALVADNTAVLREIKESGINAFVSSRDMKSMKELDEALEKFKSNRKKAQV